MKTIFSSLALILALGSAQAQTFCDSINISSINYSPFTDTAIYIHVYNNSSVLVDYPGFALINSNGDTVAKETVNFFGIGQESIHMLNVYPGVQDPLLPFDGELHLWSGFWQTQMCVWPVNQGLCGDSPCHQSIIAMNNWGGAIAIGDFDWVISSQSNPNVASGTLTTTFQEQYDADTVCLSPGNYTASVTTQNQPSGGGPWITFGESQYGGPSLQYPFDWYNGLDFDIPYFTFCIGNPNAIIEMDEPGFQATSTSHGIRVSVENSTLGRILIHVVTGRILLDEDVNAFSVVYRPETSGVYIIQRIVGSDVKSVKVVWP
jgi:hypothetical protein